MSYHEDRIVRLALDPKVHQRFRVVAAEEGASMAKVARRVVEGFVEARSAEREAEKGAPARRPRK